MNQNTDKRTKTIYMDDDGNLYYVTSLPGGTKPIWTTVNEYADKLTRMYSSQFQERENEDYAQNDLDAQATIRGWKPAGI